MFLSDPKTLPTPRGTFTYRNAGSGAPLVMIHGWPESSYSWEHVSRHLDTDFHIIAPDLRGLGVAKVNRFELAKEAHGCQVWFVGVFARNFW